LSALVNLPLLTGITTGALSAKSLATILQFAPMMGATLVSHASMAACARAKCVRVPIKPSHKIHIEQRIIACPGLGSLELLTAWAS